MSDPWFPRPNRLGSVLHGQQLALELREQRPAWHEDPQGSRSLAAGARNLPPRGSSTPSLSKGSFFPSCPARPASRRIPAGKLQLSTASCQGLERGTCWGRREGFCYGSCCRLPHLLHSSPCPAGVNAVGKGAQP